jgi:hypothetical protein
VTLANNLIQLSRVVSFFNVLIKLISLCSDTEINLMLRCQIFDLKTSSALCVLVSGEREGGSVGGL